MTEHHATADRRPAASLIISIYKDIEALECIFAALEGQSAKSFEVIVSEDGEDSNVAAYVAANRQRFPLLQHLTQEDIGFRKNRALNRAVAAARSDYLIFIDGDCIPHQRFIENHLALAEHGTINAGRRVELGPRYSAALRAAPRKQQWFNSNLRYLFQSIGLHRDGIAHFEDGIISPLFNKLVRNRRITLLGCNFSCYKEALLAVNGFNEEYQRAGIGEDVDLEYRMRESGFRFKSIKQMSVVFHLDHKVGYSIADDNKAILKRTREERILRPEKGLSQHL